MWPFWHLSLTAHRIHNSPQNCLCKSTAAPLSAPAATGRWLIPHPMLPPPHFFCSVLRCLLPSLLVPLWMTWCQTFPAGNREEAAATKRSRENMEITGGHTRGKERGRQSKEQECVWEGLTYNVKTCIGEWHSKGKCIVFMQQQTVLRENMEKRSNDRGRVCTAK